MKIVREHIILEKFSEDGDPIADLGIGKYEVDFWNIFKPMYDEYQQKHGQLYLEKYTHPYFKKFKEIVEPLIIGRYLKGHIWRVGSPGYCGEDKFKVYRIQGKTGVSLFRNQLFQVEVETKRETYLVSYALYATMKYKVTSK